MQQGRDGEIYIRLPHGSPVWHMADNAYQTKDGTMLDVTTARAEKYFKPTYAKFRSDGTYVGIGQFGDGVADYKAKGKTITCYIDGAEYLRFDIISLVGGIAEMEMYIEKGGKPYRIRCEKQ